MKTEDVDKILSELEQIRKGRRERGDVFVDSVLEASKTIRSRYEKWYGKAISELYKEIELMNDLIPNEELDKRKSDLLTVESKFTKNKAELKKFIETLEQGCIKSFEDIRISQGQNEDTLLTIPDMQNSTKKTVDLSVVFDALSIAREIEEMEKSVERLSRFMINVIELTKRVS
jgi:hypothetical protein